MERLTLEESMGKRFFGLTLSAVLVALCFTAEAQQPGKVARIGLLGGMSASTFADRMKVFRQQLRDLGYSEGKNIAFEERWAEGNLDRLDDLAAELVRAKVDVLVTFGGTGPALVAKKATSTIPIVMAAVGYRSGQSRPNCQPRSTRRKHDWASKQFPQNYVVSKWSYLRMTVPKLSRIAVIWNPDSPGRQKQTCQETESEARALGLRVQSLEV